MDNELERTLEIKTESGFMSKGGLDGLNVGVCLSRQNGVLGYM